MATKRKPAAKKPAARKPATKKPAAKKVVASKPVARKSPVAGKRPGALRRVPGEAMRLAGVGTDAVARATGKAWDQWLAVLDKAGAAKMPHKAIAEMLSRKFGVPGWWSQMVTVGYEQARGLREAFQKPDGFSASASRTMLAPVDRLFGAWSDPGLRSLWLGAAPVAVKRSTQAKSLRMTWTDGGSSVEVNFYPAGAGRSRVQVQHDKLADGRAREAQKAFWSEALDRLKAMLEKAA
ncbi:MAG: SRPBCC domain-containing protein [Burkholderiales bacterium]